MTIVTLGMTDFLLMFVSLVKVEVRTGNLERRFKSKYALDLHLTPQQIAFALPQSTTFK